LNRLSIIELSEVGGLHSLWFFIEEIPNYAPALCSSRESAAPDRIVDRFRRLEIHDAANPSTGASRPNSAAWEFGKRQGMGVVYKAGATQPFSHDTEHCPVR